MQHLAYWISHNSSKSIFGSRPARTLTGIDRALIVAIWPPGNPDHTLSLIATGKKCVLDTQLRYVLQAGRLGLQVTTFSL